MDPLIAVALAALYLLVCASCQALDPTTCARWGDALTRTDRRML